LFECDSSRPWCLGGQHLSISSGQIRGFTNTSTFIDPFQVETANLSGDFYGQYRIKSVREFIERGPLLHAIEFQHMEGRTYSLSVTGPNDFERVVPFLGGETVGILLALPAPGDYRLTADGETLCNGNGDKFAVGSGETIFDLVEFCGFFARQGSLTPGAVAGISIAVIIVVIVAGVGVWFFKFRDPAGYTPADHILESAPDGPDEGYMSGL
jgi:hypothetical protein